MKRRSRAEAGFTLVEILVVMTLMSLVMLALGAAMRSIAQTEERVDERLHRSDEMRVATNFLSSTLGRISVRKTQAPTQVGTSLYLFSARRDAVMWVGVMPARYGAGGRYFFRLAPEQREGRSALVIRFLPWNGAATFPDWATSDSRVLLRDMAGLRLEYAQEEGATQTWLPEWIDPLKLPARVRISLRTPAVEWPQIVIALRQLPAADNGRGGFSLGPE